MTLDTHPAPSDTPPEVEGEAIPVIRVRKTRVQRGYPPGKASWALRWRDPSTGRVRQETLGQGRERWAEALREIKMAELNGCRLDAQGGTTWRAFVRRCLAAKTIELAPASLAVLRQVLARFEASMRPRVLQAVDRAAVNEYRLRRLKEVSRRTAEKDLRTLRSAFSWAVGEGLLETNPCEGIRWGGRPMVYRPDVYTLTETRWLLAALSEEPAWLAAALHLAAKWGPRTGELANLEAADVDWAERIVHVGARGRRRPKNRRERAFPLDDAAAGLLFRLRDRQGPLLWGPPEAPFSNEKDFRRGLCVEARRVLAAVGLGEPDQPIQKLRRTAISNARDLVQDEKLLEAIFGNTRGVQDRFYDGRSLRHLVTRMAEIDGAPVPNV